MDPLLLPDSSSFSPISFLSLSSLIPLSFYLPSSTEFIYHLFSKQDAERIRRLGKKNSLAPPVEEDTERIVCPAFCSSRSRRTFSINERTRVRKGNWSRGRGRKKKDDNRNRAGDAAVRQRCQINPTTWLARSRNDLINRSHVASWWRVGRISFGRQKAPRQIVDQIEERRRERGSPYVHAYTYTHTVQVNVERNTPLA